MAEIIPDGKREFPTTSHTLHQRIHSPSQEESAAALESFFSVYWLPLYGFLRASGETHEDAGDYLQAFVSEELLSRKQLSKWDPERGSLRGFLKTCLDRFRRKQKRGERALKRGGDRASNHISLDLDWAEGYFSDHTLDGESPDRHFDREWAAAIVNRTTTDLAGYYQEKGKSDEFRLLLLNLELRGETGETAKYDSIASELGTSVEAVKQRMRTFRARFHQRLRHVVRDFVREDEVEDEIGFLLETLGR